MCGKIYVSIKGCQKFLVRSKKKGFPHGWQGSCILSWGGGLPSFVLWDGSNVRFNKISFHLKLVCKYPRIENSGHFELWKCDFKQKHFWVIQYRT